MGTRIKRLFSSVPNFRSHRRPVITLAVVGDADPGRRQDSFDSSLRGGRAGLWFPTVTVLDYEARWEELEQSASPFAIMVMAHLKAMATHGEPNSRLQ